MWQEFGRFGPIASVKIMWPRTEEDKRKIKNSGFVCYLDRKHAETAKEEMHGFLLFYFIIWIYKKLTLSLHHYYYFFKGRELGGYEIRVGWGKPVPGSKLTTPLPVLSNLPVNFFEMFFHI